MRFIVKIALRGNGQGVCLWFDVVPGMMYSLVTEAGASEKGILKVAGEVFVAMQEH